MKPLTPTDDHPIARGFEGLAVAESTGITELSPLPVSDEIAAFHTSGVGAVRGLLDAAEVDEIRQIFQAAGDQGPIDGLADASMLDPQRAGRDAMLRRFPRMIHPHRHPGEPFGRLALRWMLSERIGHVLRRLMGQEPLAAQSMFYFKGPGAKGQSLHQDNLFLDVQPGTCIAAWIAIDQCDEENGCLVVVPGTGNWRIVCEGRVETEDTVDEFFDRSSLPLPEGCNPRPGDPEGRRRALLQRLHRPRQLPQPLTPPLPPFTHLPLRPNQLREDQRVLSPPPRHARLNH